MFIVELFDTEPGFEGKAVFGPFNTREQAQTEAAREREAAQAAMLNPSFIRVYVKQVQ